MQTISVYTIHLPETGGRIMCKPKEVLLLAMARSGGKGIAVGCRSGGCGVCKVRILRGEYQCEKMSRAHVSEEEERQGFVLACRCRPLSDVWITVVGKSAE